MLPTTQEYKISLMIGADSFRTLQDIEIVPNPKYPNEPWFSTGGLAIVFKIKMKGKFYALKCFYAEANQRQERLGHIATYLKQNPSPYFVDFTYLDNELWVETAQGGNGYPVVLMEWVEGKTLDNYLEDVCKRKDKIALQNLYFRFCNLAWWLHQQPIAHGDLKHDNMLVTAEGNIKLIDYDGMFVPALSGRKANELGSPCYQHPQRDFHLFDSDLDDFSLLVLQITLLALQHEPSLFAKHYNGDGILLKDTDYRNFSGSSIKTTLWQLPEVKLPLLLSQVQASLSHLKAIDLMPLIQDVVWINWLIAGQKDSKLATERQIIKNLIGGQKDNNLATERQRLKELVLKNSRWKDLLIALLSQYHPLNENLLKKYQDRWDWGRLSSNTGLPWTIELIEMYQDRWNWNILSGKTGLPWTIELIEMYKNKWDWGGLSRNTGLPWTRELIEMYKNRWRWIWLSGNTSLPWTMELIEKYKDRWDWRFLSWNIGLLWTSELIEKYQNRWNWDELSWNEGLPWTMGLIEKYKDRWNWSGLLSLSRNRGLPWTQELIEKYQNRWNWSGLSGNKGLPWTSELIEMYKNKWDWSGLLSLSNNTGLPWTRELIEMYKNKLDWSGLSSNTGLPWTRELIEMYKNKWDWGGLSSNTDLPWTRELIEKYKDIWSWKELSEKSCLPWTRELIEMYKNKLDWSKLSRNEGLPWTMGLIEKYQNNWEWKTLSRNKGTYEKAFKPLLDDEFIDEIMAEITKKYE